MSKFTQAQAAVRRSRPAPRRKRRSKGKLLLLFVLAAVVLGAGLLFFRHTSEPELSQDDYPESLLKLLERNPETEEFVRGYPDHEKKPVDLSGYDRKAGVPLFLQWDPQWGYEPYGGDMIAITGCGPTALGMAGYYLTGDARFSPDSVAVFAEENGYYVSGSGSSWTLISEGGKKLGLDVVEIPLDEYRIIRNLEVHNPVICAVGPGDFTREGHFIVLTGVENGLFRVNDPNSRIKSEKLWSYATLAPQIQNLWVIRL